MYIYILNIMSVIYLSHIYSGLQRRPLCTEMLTVLLCHFTMNSYHRLLLIHVPRAAKIHADSTGKGSNLSCKPRGPCRA